MDFAGASQHAAVEEASSESLDRLFQVNAIAPLRLTRAVLPFCISRRDPSDNLPEIPIVEKRWRCRGNWGYTIRMTESPKGIRAAIHKPCWLLQSTRALQSFLCTAKSHPEALPQAFDFGAQSRFVPFKATFPNFPVSHLEAVPAQMKNS